MSRATLNRAFRAQPTLVPAGIAKLEEPLNANKDNGRDEEDSVQQKLPAARKRTLKPDA
ncbi:MAG: hypothetical protein H0U02_01885 [Rubrobacter sp.]|nr:hypothetical protein [Rubrobacter sp.]